MTLNMERATPPKRTRAPAAIASSAQFRDLCPASAVCMMRALQRAAAAAASGDRLPFTQGVRCAKAA